MALICVGNSIVSSAIMYKHTRVSIFKDCCAIAWVRRTIKNNILWVIFCLYRPTLSFFVTLYSFRKALLCGLTVKNIPPKTVLAPLFLFFAFFCNSWIWNDCNCGNLCLLTTTALYFFELKRNLFGFYCFIQSGYSIYGANILFYTGNCR